MAEGFPHTSTAPRADVDSLLDGDRALAAGNEFAHVQRSFAQPAVTGLPELPPTDLRRPRLLGGVRRVGPSKAVQYALKRVLDVAGSVVLAVLLLPVALLIVIVVKATSHGPVLYRSPRLGLGGRRFECLKFRTMHVGADLRQQELEHQNEANGPIFKIAHDPRITVVGQFLRKTALDELPQFFNILRGEMSLVGPRPLPLRDCDLLHPEEHRRHAVLPGMTGLWQISPERHGADGAPIMQLDLEYVDRWSLWLDVVITMRTFVVILRGGADASQAQALESGR